MTVSHVSPPAEDQAFWSSSLHRARAALRQGEAGLILLALVAGAIAGAGVVLLSNASRLLHILFYHLGPDGSLSAIDGFASPWLALIPAGGGLALGVMSRIWQRWRPRRPVDPIEANALHGGRMSVSDSLMIAFQTLISSGCGASVGLEAAYTQLGSGLASRIGTSLNLRRVDQRMLVGAGTAGAIAAAFGAPLTGAFYAFELIIGSYTPFGLAPVIAAAISGRLIAEHFGTGESFIGQIGARASAHGADIVMVLALALVCAGIGIAVMRLVTIVESLFKRSHLPVMLQPAVGGLALGAMALTTPHILSAGHGALTLLLHDAAPTLAVIAALLCLKILASSISIGAGFRGGLFFASLYLGALTGKVFYALIALFSTAPPLDGMTCAVAGMAALSAAIIGGPLTMSFLALEATQDFELSILILAACTLVSFVVRRGFGYSFATWRLHLRGESIKSGQDVSWVRGLSVKRLMRTSVETASAHMMIQAFVEAHPLSSGHWIVATEADGRYAGMISVAEAHVAADEGGKGQHPLLELLQHKDVTLKPDQNIREAANIFEASESEALAVTSGDKVVGFLAESTLLRRYTEELDRARRDLSGEHWLR